MKLNGIYFCFDHHGDTRTNLYIWNGFQLIIGKKIEQ